MKSLLVSEINQTKGHKYIIILFRYLLIIGKIIGRKCKCILSGIGGRRNSYLIYIEFQTSNMKKFWRLVVQCEYAATELFP